MAPRPVRPTRRRLIAALAALAALLPASASARAAAEDDEWVVLKPVKLVSAGGATFTPKPDGSIAVGGANPDKDSWTLDFECDVRGITALRLEALADASLPASGPGRATNGNFVLNEMELEACSKLAVRLKPVTLQNATCDFVEGHRRASDVHDGERNAGGNGWAVYGAVGKDHELIAELQRDLDFGATALLRVTLHFNWGSQHALGRFRLAATKQPRPVRVAGAAEPESALRLQERVNQAIDRGVEWLVTHQQLDGSWNFDQPTYRNGCTALATYTLLKSGVNKRHPAVQRALEFMRCNPSRETYTIGCQLMALGAYDDPAHLPWMKELVETLLTFQRGGGFNYPWGSIDLSNTQYGILGLRAAAKHGLAVPAVAFDKAAQQALQWGDAASGGAYGGTGFSYSGVQKPNSSMTAAGASILAISAQQLQGSSKAAGYLQGAKAGVEWLAAHFAVDDNVGGDNDRWDLYYLYGLERVASLLGLDKVGGRDWYREGAKHLCDRQGGGGEWGTAYAEHEINTCFALLFLNRATAPVSGESAPRLRLYGGDDAALPISLRASGDTPLTMWISRFGEKELALHEWPGEDDRGLRVTKVEWLAAGGELGADGKVVATIEKDGQQPCGRERFGAQWSFALPGAYQLRARVTLLSPPAEGGASEPATIESPWLAVKVDEAMDPELLQYARDPGRNLLVGQKVAARGSTTINGDWSADRAVDNLQTRGWASSNDDPIPVLTLDLEKPVRATTLLLTPAKIGDTFQSRITKIAVSFNGKQPPLLIDVPVTAERRKVRVKLTQAIVVRKIEVKVLARQESPNADKAVGFAEVELQADKPGGN